MPHQDIEQRLFTVEEANACIPQLEAWLADMRELRERMEGLRELIEPVLSRAHLNSGSRAASEFAAALHRYQAMTERITEEGIVVRDITTGLLDFPAWRDGRLVCLCWLSGEEAVEHWHEMDTGFAGRQKLGDLDDDGFGAAKSAADEV
jgi:hypothetical protein